MSSFNIDLWRQHLPCLVRFASKAQEDGAPGPQEHTGILFDVKPNKKGSKASTYEFYVLFADPLNIDQSGAVTLVDKAQRRLKVFTGFHFTMTCYYNWDVNGNLASTTRYLRDFVSKYIQVQVNPQTDKWVAMDQIVTSRDTTVPLRPDTLPMRNEALLDAIQGFSAQDVITRHHLYGRRKGDGNAKEQRTTQHTTRKAKSKRGRGRTKRRTESEEDEDEKEDENENSESDSESEAESDTQSRGKKMRKTRGNDEEDEWLPKSESTHLQKQSTEGEQLSEPYSLFGPVLVLADDDKNNQPMTSVHFPSLTLPPSSFPPSSFPPSSETSETSSLFPPLLLPPPSPLDMVPSDNLFEGLGDFGVENSLHEINNDGFAQFNFFDMNDQSPNLLGDEYQMPLLMPPMDVPVF